MKTVKFLQDTTIPTYPAFTEGQVVKLSKNLAAELSQRGIVTIEKRQIKSNPLTTVQND